jgi:acetyl-CoA carboxylase carboxyl transferase subunit beta
MTGPARLKALFDDGKYAPLHLPDVPYDPLKFRDERRYTDRLKDARSKTGLNDALHSGLGKLHGDTVVAAVQDFDFMGGSLGTAAGEAVISSMRAALVRNAPFILFAASGGARMQEGILSLMQMPRTTVAVQELREAALPYIVVLTNPTTGGVTASYAMLGDIHIAEPGALIGFAGPRVIEQTIREQLPAGFQRSEYLLEHGMVDMVIHRHDLRATLARLCNLLLHRRQDVAVDDEAEAITHRPADNGSAIEQSTADAESDPARPSGNGLDRSDREEPEAGKVVAQAPTTGANQQTSHNA